MALDVAGYENSAAEAVKIFWQTREAAKRKSGNTDRGERGSATAGKNMDGFLLLVERITRANGLENAEIHQQRGMLTLPGFFRPTKLWDLLVTYKGELVLGIELKSQVGSFGNNFNNRTEEAIGTAHDLWVAYREGSLGSQPRPFIGWLMLVEDAEDSRKPVRCDSPHFAARPEFRNASYLERYDLLCQKLIQENLYTTATLLTSPRSAIETGEFREISAMTGLKAFATSLAGHVAATAARLS